MTGQSLGLPTSCVCGTSMERLSVMALDGVRELGCWGAYVCIVRT